MLPPLPPVLVLGLRSKGLTRLKTTELLLRHSTVYFPRPETSPCTPALAALDQSLVKIPLRRKRRPGATLGDPFRFDLLVFFHYCIGNRAGSADALRPEEHLGGALEMNRIQARLLNRIADDVGAVSPHHQGEMLAHRLGCPFAVFIIGTVKPRAHRDSLAELDGMLMDRHDLLPRCDQRNRHRWMAGNDRDRLRTFRKQRRKEKYLGGWFAPTWNFFAVKIVFQDLILRQIGIEGGPHGHDEKAIAARRAAAYMSPHIRQLPAQNLYSRCQLVLEFIRVAHNSPLSQGCLRLEVNSRQQ